MLLRLSAIVMNPLPFWLKILETFLFPPSLTPILGFTITSAFFLRRTDRESVGPRDIDCTFLYEIRKKSDVRKRLLRSRIAENATEVKAVGKDRSSGIYASLCVSDRCLGGSGLVVWSYSISDICARGAIVTTERRSSRNSVHYTLVGMWDWLSEEALSQKKLSSFMESMDISTQDTASVCRPLRRLLLLLLLLLLDISTQDIWTLFMPPGAAARVCLCPILGSRASFPYCPVAVLWMPAVGFLSFDMQFANN